MRESNAFEWLASLGLAACILLRGSVLQARAEAEIGYTKEQAFSASLRYLRVDLGYEVTEKDADAAYVLFRFVPDGQRDRTMGSVEVVEVGEGVKLLVQIAQMPGYYETVLCDGLVRKLQQEYGDPPSRSRSTAGKKQREKHQDPDKSRDGDQDQSRDHDEDQNESRGRDKDESAKDPEPH
jgi:hypothetical protein